MVVEWLQDVMHDCKVATVTGLIPTVDLCCMSYRPLSPIFCLPNNNNNN